MAKVICGISIENGVPRIRLFTPEEQRQFTKTHPNLQLPTFTSQEVIKGLELALLPQSPSPGTDPTNLPSAK
jgi:hypothetical protein